MALEITGMDGIQMVDLKQQLAPIKEQILQDWMTLLDDNAFINGPIVTKFTNSLSQYFNGAEVIPCGNGTDALQIALMALDLKPGDGVITTPFTFVATAEVIALLGLKPVFVDIDPRTFNIDVNQLEAAMQHNVKAIIPVHLFGQISEMETILTFAKKYNLFVVEDNAQSIGSWYSFSNGIKAQSGLMGHIGCTSFYPTKNLGAYGDGGALYTNDTEIAEKIRLISNHGAKVKYHYESIGVNSRLDAVQAAVLNAKLPHLDTYCANRHNAAAQYDIELDNIEGLTIPYRSPYSTHSFHQYTILVNDRDALQTFLKSHGIPTMIYYPVPLHISSAYSKYGYAPGDFPNSEYAANHVLSLPMHSELPSDQIQFITSTIRSFFSK